METKATLVFLFCPLKEILYICCIKINMCFYEEGNT